MDLKKPLTFDEQLDKLVAHGMITIDRQKAKDIQKKMLLLIWLVLEEIHQKIIFIVYRNDIDLELIGFPENYLEIMKNNL